MHTNLTVKATKSNEKPKINFQTHEIVKLLPFLEAYSRIISYYTEQKNSKAKLGNGCFKHCGTIENRSQISIYNDKFWWHHLVILCHRPSSSFGCQIIMLLAVLYFPAICKLQSNPPLSHKTEWRTSREREDICLLFCNWRKLKWNWRWNTQIICVCLNTVRKRTKQAVSDHCCLFSVLKFPKTPRVQFSRDIGHCYLVNYTVQEKAKIFFVGKIKIKCFLSFFSTDSYNDSFLTISFVDALKFYIGSSIAVRSLSSEDIPGNFAYPLIFPFPFASSISFWNLVKIKISMLHLKSRERQSPCPNWASSITSLFSQTRCNLSCERLSLHQSMQYKATYLRRRGWAMSSPCWSHICCFHLPRITLYQMALPDP